MDTNPIKDKNRIEEIARLRLHEDQVDDLLQSYAQKAADEFDLPMGLVSIVLDDAQKFAAAHGLGGWLKEVNGTPLEWSFCANSVDSRRPFIVEDASLHRTVKDNPMVTQDGVKCYAGAPMITHNGYVIGNFCVIGTDKRSFTGAEISKLKKYAAEIVEHLEKRVK